MSARIKVVIVINDFLVGGAQRMMAQLLTRLDRSRFEPVLVTLFDFQGRDTMYDLVPKDVPVLRLSFSGFSDLRNWLALARILRVEQPDVVLSNLFFSNTVVRLLSIFVRFPVVTVEHNTYIHKTYMQIVCDRLLANITARIVAVSSHVRDFTVRQERISEGRFVVIPNGVDTRDLSERASRADVGVIYKELGIETSDTLIITVGRMTAQKDLPLMVDGFAAYARAHEGVHLVILGDGGLRADIEAKVRERGLGNRIKLLGNRADVIPYYAASAFFLSTSHIEGLSMAHLEALSCGLPLLSTRTAGAEELIEEGKNGLFIQDRTPEAVAKGIEHILSYDRGSLKQAAHETVSHFDIARAVKSYELLFTAVKGR